MNAGIIDNNRFGPYGEAISDPSGHIAILPLIAKGATSAVADYLMQVAMNYFFNPATQGNLKSSLSNVNEWQVLRSGLEGLLPWKKPGGKFTKAALSAVGDVIVNALNNGKYRRTSTT